MSEDKEILNKLNDIQNKLETIELEIDEIKDKEKHRERPLNFWEFLLEVEWFQICGFILVILFVLKKI